MIKKDFEIAQKIWRRREIMSVINGGTRTLMEMLSIADFSADSWAEELESMEHEGIIEFLPPDARSYGLHRITTGRNWAKASRELWTGQG